ncbi:hypothetical protein EV682_107100 [Iodobacter fluviatilis]|uniref:Uncharacterized protein n=1 Tax=Iodobacter fluviatilis TaxID=537 RepID=A0A377SSF4_9NEIS|nr:hypothetical protein EV682_107100 [Iodobacter fluviatilis]STR44962.1 Uncharacterised protein [Iodobacter fluviatilis]
MRQRGFTPAEMTIVPVIIGKLQAGGPVDFKSLKERA